MRIAKIILSGLLTFILLMAVIATVAIVVLRHDLPDVNTLKNVELQQPMQVFSADGKLIGEVGEQRRIPVSLDKIPPLLIEAFLATEDSRFYEHFGLDPVGISRAIMIAIANGGKIKQGASTITQQLARNFFLTNERTFTRKAKEAILALEIEGTMSKQEILELYLNKIYLGNRAYGVAAAAQTYFGKTLDQLTLSEMAIIAGLPKAPSSLNPLSSVKRATERRNLVLARMLDVKAINQEQYEQAKNEPVEAKYHGSKLDLSADYVTEMVRQQMVEKYGEEEAYNKGFKVYTTINSEAQLAAQNAVRNNLIAYDKRHGYRKPNYLWLGTDEPWTEDHIKNYLRSLPSGKPFVPAAVINKTAFGLEFMLASGEKSELTIAGMEWIKKAHEPNVGDLIWVRQVDGQWQLGQIPKVNSGFVSLNSTDGAIEALVGGFSFGFSKFNRATQSLVQVGSVIKPFIFAAALERGLTLATVLQDSPIVLTQGVGLPNWQPLNSPNQFDGAMRIRKGLGLSKNMISIRVIKMAGVPFTAKYLSRFGLPENRYSENLSLALGAAEFTPLELARAYAVLDNGGFLITPYLIQKVVDNKDQEVFVANPQVACPTCDDIPVQYGEVEKIDSSKQEEFANVDVIDDDKLSAGNPMKDSEGKIKDITKDTENKADPIVSLQSLNNNDFMHKAQQNAQAPTLSPALTQSKYAPRVINGGIAFLIKSALHTAIYGENNQGWLGTSWRIRNSIKRSDIAGKTGTTNKNKVAWYAGFAGNITTTTYIGFDNNALDLGRNESGAKSAMPAWIDYMKVVLANVPDAKIYVPSNITTRVIEPETGLLMPEGSKGGLVEYFLINNVPTQTYIPQGQGYIDINAEDGGSNSGKKGDNFKTNYEEIF